MSFCGVSHVTIDNIQSILTLVISILTLSGLLAGAWFAISQRKLYKELVASEEAIRAKQDELDNVEPNVNGRTSGHSDNKIQRLLMVIAERAPKQRELERLKEERGFIKDRLIFSNNKKRP